MPRGARTGLRGEPPQKVQFDLSNTFGLSDADFTVRDTANVSLGASSPTTFYGGSARTTEDVVDLTFRRATPEILAGGNVAAGLEYRHDTYRITPGSPRDPPIPSSERARRPFRATIPASR